MPKVPGGPKSLNDMLETVYAAALKEYDGDEAKASAAAWAAAEKAGWKKDKDGKWVKEERKNEEPQPMRLLASPWDRKNEMVEVDGDLLVKGVRMLAAGTWTDSAVQTPLNYPAATLQKYATNWQDTAGWTRHTGGFPRDATDKVAEIRNPRFEQDAVVADILIYKDTQKGRDMAAQVQKGRVKYVSVEHTGDERYNASTRQLEATSINFSGFAFVNKGACKLCRINEEAPQADVPESDAPAEVPEEVDMKELEELKAQVAELTRQLSEHKPEATKVAEPVVADTSRELEEAAAQKAAAEAQAAAAAAQRQVAELQAQMKELMSRPAAPAVVAAAPQALPQKELKDPEFTARIDRKNRFVEVY